MKYKVVLNGKTYEVEVERGEAQLVSVTDTVIAAPTVPTVTAAPVQAAAPAAPAAPTTPAQTAAGDTVKAPMPGIILNVNVTIGQAVKRGQHLCILEAMKMENEISAPRDGTVAQILVSKGNTVEAGAPLVILT